MDKHNGAGFGCWCTWFHQRRKDQGIDTEIEAGRPFLYNATRGMYEKAAFTYERPKGKNHCVMRKVVPAAAS